MLNTGLPTPVPEVEGVAQCALLMLRLVGTSDETILKEFCPSDDDPKTADCDARYEARQIRNCGMVVTPARDVRAAMRRLVLAGVTL